jgi:toxin CptA
MLSVSLKGSRLLAVLLIAMHALGAVLLWSFPLVLWLKAAATSALLASLVFYLRRDALRSLPQSVTALSLNSECGCAIQSVRGQWLETRLLASSFVSPYLTVLNLSPHGAWGARHVVIFPDAVDPEAFRQLRVLLKWKCPKEAGRPGT